MERIYVVRSIEKTTLYINHNDVEYFRVGFDSAKESDVEKADTIFIHIPTHVSQPLIGDRWLCNIDKI